MGAAAMDAGQTRLTLADFHAALTAFAGELYDHHADKGVIWSTQSPLFHLHHARDHLIAAVHLLETHGSVEAIAGHIQHGQSRAIMACEAFLRQQAGAA